MDNKLVLGNSNLLFTQVVYNGGIWRATGSGFFKFLTTLKLLKPLKLPFHKKHHFLRQQKSDKNY